MYRALLLPKTIALLGLMMSNTRASRDYRMEVIGNSGFVASPNYPEKYPNNISCLWNVTVEYGLALNATVLTMDMEKTAGCHADFLQIRTSPNGQWKDYERYCFGAPGPIFSESGWAQIRFVSDTRNQFSGFNLTWSAVARTLRPSESSINLRPIPSMPQNCIGTQIFYDTVTISSCLRSHTDPAAVHSVLNRTNCLCGPLKSSIYSSWPSTSKRHTILQTPTQSFLLDTYLKSSPPTITEKLVESSEGRSSFSHSRSTTYSSAKSKHWETEVLHSQGTFSSVEESSWKAKVLQSSGASSSTQEQTWKSKIAYSSGTFTSFLKERSLNTKILPSSDKFASSVNDIPRKTDILQSLNTFSASVKEKPRKTEIFLSSNTISSSLWDKPGTTLPLSSNCSKIHGVKNESRNVGFSSSIQTAQVNSTSTGFLFTSHMPDGCQEKAKVDSIHSSLVTILWPVGGTFLFIAILFFVLLCKETKSNRINTTCDGSYAGH